MTVLYVLTKFQSTLPQGERPTLAYRLRGSKNDFNPRSHKGSDELLVRLYFLLPEFQSTLPQGERHAPAMKKSVVGLFQSTLPQGERRLRNGSSPQRRHFNPRSHKGSDCREEEHGTRVTLFQSTLPQGERRYSGGNTAELALNFNPRSHKGSDSNFTQNSISVLFHIYQSFPYIIFPHTALFRLLIIFCTFFLVRIAQGFPVCFHFAPKQYPAFYNAWSTDLL